MSLLQYHTEEDRAHTVSFALRWIQYVREDLARLISARLDGQPGRRKYEDYLNDSCDEVIAALRKLNKHRMVLIIKRIQKQCL
jgi:hypothetical protein